MENINEKVKAIVAEKLGVDIEMVVDSANFQSDLGADSLDIVELVMDFEKEFGIEIPDDDAGDNIVTVADAIKYIEKKVQEK
jgi:acyl carrier protein